MFDQVVETQGNAREQSAGRGHFMIGQKKYLLIYLIAVLHMLVLASWIADDAMFTLRQVYTTVEGQGIVWNLGQRVQAFTHPTWWALLTAGYALTGSLYVMTIAVSAACALGAFALYYNHVGRHAVSPSVAIALLALPLASEGITDYVASGLENPLSFFLVAAVFALLARAPSAATDRRLWLVFALAVLTRQDHALLLAPVALWVFVARGPLVQVRRAVPGIALLVAWFGFATFYFGSPLPNTYYAKLTAGIPDAAVAEMTADYIRSCLRDTPVTSALILLGLVSAAVRGTLAERLVAVGICLHLFYLARIGGDFMQGRLISVDAFAGCFLLANGVRLLPRPALSALVALAILGAAYRTSDLYTWTEGFRLKTVIDERKYYYAGHGMLSSRRLLPAPEAPASETDRDRWIATACGFMGRNRMEVPDTVRLVDRCGLADPYLARLPMMAMDDVRAGHFIRAVPAGYAAAYLRDDLSGLPDDTHVLWRDVRLVTEGDLFAPGRLAAVGRLIANDYGFDPVAWTEPESAPVPMLGGDLQWLTDSAGAPEVYATTRLLLSD